MLAQLLLELRALISVPAQKGHSTKLWGPQPCYGSRRQPGASGWELWELCSPAGAGGEQDRGTPLARTNLGLFCFYAPFASSYTAAQPHC